MPLSLSWFLFWCTELGRHGFFTLSHTVRAFNFSALPALSDVDSACVLNLLTQRMPSFNAHVQSTCARLLSHAAACAAGGAMLSGPAATRDMTVAQANADLRTFWEYGLESLGDESLRAERRAAHAQAPSGLFFFGAARGASGSEPSDTQSSTMVRSAGLKHYTGLSGYYSRLLQAHPYLPLDGLLPSLSAYSPSPLHALLRLSDPLTGAAAVRTLILRQTTPFHDNEVEVLDALVPAAWKKKKRRIVAQEDEEELSQGSVGVGDDSDSEPEEEESSSSSSEEEEDDDASSDEERKAPAPKPSKTKVPAAAAPRLKKESPGLKDARLLAHLYAILVQVASDLLREMVSAPASQQQQQPAHFPSFATVRDRVSALVQHLRDAKWVPPQWHEALRTQACAAGAVVDPASPAGGVLGMDLWRVDAFGRRVACDLSAPVPLDHSAPLRRMYTFSLYLHRIPSAELLSLTDDDVELGSVGFGETFLRDAMAPGAAGAGVAPPSQRISEEEQREEKKRLDDPKYFGTGLMSSSAVDAAALAAAAAAAAAATKAGAGAASMLVLTAAIPSLITLPSFCQLYELKALQALVSSYAHASARTSLQSAAEVAAAGLVPIHPTLGAFLLDGSSPRLQSSLLARPPTSALVGAGARISLFDPAGFTPPCFVGQRVGGATTPLYLWRTDHWISASPLGGVAGCLLLSTPLHPVLHGSLALFERGFVFHSAATGSLMVDFARHVLECAYFDGSGDERDANAQHGNNSDDDDEEEDEGPDDNAPVALAAHPEADHDGGEDDSGVGDALFTLDIMEPASEADAQSTPYTLLRSLESAAAASLPGLAPLATNQGVPPPKSRFARAAYSLAIVLPKGSALARAWAQSVQAAWAHSLDALNIHNDHADAVAPFARDAYFALQEQHEFQRREARRAKRAALETSAKAASPVAARHKDEDDEDGEDGARSPSASSTGAAAAAAAVAASLVLPDATCDFLHDYRVHEQMRAQQDAQRAAEGSVCEQWQNNQKRNDAVGS